MKARFDSSAALLGGVTLGVLLLALLSPAPPLLFVALLALTITLHFVSNVRIVRVLSAALFSGWMLFSLMSEVPSAHWTDVAPVDAYNVLADQISHGTLSMPVDPDPRLSQLANPYSPEERQRSGIPFAWDHSLYGGHYYLYWGITPILTVLLPFRWVSGVYLSELGQLALFGLLAYLLLYVFVLRLFRRVAGTELDAVESFLLAGTLALCTEFASTMRQAAIYQISIFACTAFTFAALLVLTLPPRTRGRLFGAGALFGFAIGCRPTALAALLVVPVFVEGYRQWLRLLIGMIPMGIVIGTYNFLRFGNPFESGFFYQLGVTDMTRWRVSFKNELYAFGSYLFTPLQRFREFPFLKPQVFGVGFLNFRHDYGFEPVYGVLAASPFLLLAVFLRRVHAVARSRWFWLFLLSGGVGLYLAGAAAVYRRYAVGFYPFLILPGLLALWLADRVQPSRIRRGLALVALIASLHDGFLSSLTVQSSNFATARPEWYAWIRAFFG